MIHKHQQLNRTITDWMTQLYLCMHGDLQYRAQHHYRLLKLGLDSLVA